jgi:hypothetical protein
MPATITSNQLQLQPDSLGYQGARYQLPAQPTNAETMVFYYKAYGDGFPVGDDYFEDGPGYGWNKESVFGLSFNGSLTANNGGVVGWANTDDPNRICRVRRNAFQPQFISNSRISLSASGQHISFGNEGAYFYYGSTNKGQRITSLSQYGVGKFCPTTTGIGLTGAADFLGIIKVQKNISNPSQISISVGNNWEGLSTNNFATALSSSKTNWDLFNYAQVETTNFRPYSTNPALSNTIFFPSWIVAKWPSGIVGRNLVVTNIKVEYYSKETLITIV